MDAEETKFSGTFMTVVRDCAKKLLGSGKEVNLNAPFDGFFLLKEKKGDKEPFKVFSAKQLMIESEANFFLYKIDH